MTFVNIYRSPLSLTTSYCELHEGVRLLLIQNPQGYLNENQCINETYFPITGTGIIQK